MKKRIIINSVSFIICALSSVLLSGYKPMQSDVINNTNLNSNQTNDNKGNFNDNGVGIKLIELDKEVIKEIENRQNNTYNGTNDTNSNKSLYNEKKCNSTLGYKFLAKTPKGESKQKLYNAMKKKVEDFCFSYNNVDGVRLKNDSNTYYPFCQVNYNNLGLTVDDAFMVFQTVKYDMPYMFFLSNKVSINDEEIFLHTEKEYSLHTQRKAYMKTVDEKIKEYEQLTKSCKKTYEKVLLVHDKIVRETEYNIKCIDGYYGQNILGVMDNDIANTVCYGYAASAMLILKYIGIDCEMIVGNSNGEGHAWNEVKLDDGKWYGMDVTWDDIDDITKKENDYSIAEKKGVKYTYFGCNKEEYENRRRPGENVISNASIYRQSIPSLCEGKCPYLYESITKNTSTIQEDDVEYEIYGPFATVKNYKGSKSYIKIPSMVQGKVVVSVSSEAFHNCKSLEKIDLADTIVCIEDGENEKKGAFYNCTNLCEVTFGNYINYVGKWSFAGCKNVVKMNVPKKLRHIWYDAIADCTCNMDYIRKVIGLGKEKSIISYRGFKECPDLLSVNEKATINDNGVLQYLSSEDRYEIVSSSGEIIAKKTGTVLIIGIEKKSNGESEYVTSILKILGDDNQFDDRLEIKNLKASYKYTGESITPDVNVYKDDTLLVKDKDYTISYKDNIEVGIASIIIDGKGDYQGEMTYTFIIEPIEFVEDKMNVIGFVDKVKYTGKNILQNVCVYYEEKMLQKGQDYYIEYSNNKAVGKATMKIEGCGNYSKTLQLKYVILPTKVKEIKLKELTYKSVILKWKDIQGVSGYKVEKYNFKTKKYEFLKNVKKNVVADVKLQPTTEYKYKIIPYLDSYKGTEANYSIMTRPKTPVITKKINAKNIAIDIKKTGAYTGIEIYKKVGNSGKYKLIKKSYATLSKYVDRKITKSKKYYYKVRTYKIYKNSKIYSTFSNVE